MRILQVQWIALSVLCSLLLSFWVSFVKFYNSVNSSVQYLTECRLVHNLVFSPLSVLAYKECPQYVGEVKPPSLQWYRTFEIGIAVYLFGYPILFLSVQHLANCSLSYEVCKPYTHVGFPMSELPTSRILLLLLLPYPFVFIFNADSRAEGVEFPTLYASRLSDIFLCVFLSLRSFSFRVLQKGREWVEQGFSKKKILPAGLEIFLKPLSIPIPDLPLHPERERST
mgnify:CR=1 FL=1